MSSQGMLVVFEGPDGAGKSTIAKALQAVLSQQNNKWEVIAFPGNHEGSLGKHIYNLHHSPSDFGVSHLLPESLQILHISAHVDSIEKVIKPSLRKGINIILDRYWWSTWVYGTFSGVNNKSLELMLDLEKYHWQDFTPNMVFLVDRLKSFRDEMSDNLWHKLRALYYELSEKENERYPISILRNDTTIDLAVKNSVDILRKSEKKKDVTIRATSINLFYSSSTQLNLGLEDVSNNIKKTSMISYKEIFPVVPTKVFDTYWYFAAERQNIFFKKLAGNPPPWTEDSILLHYKFTNAYRASDRVSQFLIKNVIYNGKQLPEEVFFRTLLFKVFNRISTWQLLEKELGEISLSEYSYEIYDRILTRAINSGQKIFSAAYIMPSGGRSSGYSRKHQVYLKLIETMIDDGVPLKLTYAPSMQNAFEIIKSYPLMGDFLAYQYVIDINYSELTNFSESEFVVPGPGARDGIRKCFMNLGGLSEVDIIKLMVDRQELEFARLGLNFKSLWGRRLQLIDCQNLFCEVDKYSRVAHPDICGVSNRTRIKQVYKPEQEKISYWYPPKWGINDLINIQIG